MDSWVSHRHLGDDAQQHGLHPAGRARHRVQARAAPRAVRDHEREPRAHGERQLVVGLVVAVQDHARGGRARPQAGLDLAAGGGQQVEPLLQRDPDHGVRRERLHRVERRGRTPRARRGSARAGRPRRRRERRAEPRRRGPSAGIPATTSPSGPNTAEAGQGPTGTVRCRPRLDGCRRSAIGALHRLRGAHARAAPSRFAITCFVPAQSHRRAWVSSGSSSSTTWHSV